MAIKNKYSDVDLSKYSKGYQASKDVKQAQKLKKQAEDAVKNYGNFAYGRQGDYDSAIDAILNRKAFSYDLNGDALYQQYKDQYMQQGKLAMQDTMGQASAMTGGYGNSYAASVGNQAYQGYLSQLNNLVPELYNLALSAYNAEGDRLKGNFDVLNTDRSTQYGEWTDGYNRLLNDRGYYSDNYNNAYTQDYTKWNDNRTYYTNQYWNEYNAGYQADRDKVADKQWQTTFDYNKSRDEVADSQWQTTFDYNKGRDTVADTQWQTSHDESVRQFNEQMAFNKEQAKKTSGSGGSGGSGGSKVPTDKMYEEALVLYNEGGEAALDSYFDKYPEYDISKLMSYVNTYGDQVNSKVLKDRTWTVTDDGGWNWFNGVDNNAKLTDHYGNTYTAKDLKKALINDGMSEKDANAFLKKYGVYK